MNADKIRQKLFDPTPEQEFAAKIPTDNGFLAVAADHALGVDPYGSEEDEVLVGTSHTGLVWAAHLDGEEAAAIGMLPEQARRFAVALLRAADATDAAVENKKLYSGRKAPFPKKLSWHNDAGEADCAFCASAMPESAKWPAIRVLDGGETILRQFAAVAHNETDGDMNHWPCCKACTDKHRIPGSFIHSIQANIR